MSKIQINNPSIILLAGGEKSSLIEALLHASENLKAVILPFSRNREDRYEKIKQLCAEHDIALLRPKKTELKDILSKLDAHVLISAGYPHILSKEHLICSRMNINIHPTLLPEYRGPATAWYIIVDGKTESGVTVHFIDEGMDTGDIIYQQKIQLTPFDTVYSLMRKTSNLEAKALIMALSELRSPDFTSKKQDEKMASTYPGFRKPEDSQVDPNLSLNELYNFIRACDPDKFPAFMIKDGEKVGIKLFRLQKPEAEFDSI
jgi:methionyl-tRNA formyltransferase